MRIIRKGSFTALLMSITAVCNLQAWDKILEYPSVVAGKNIESIRHIGGNDSQYFITAIEFTSTNFRSPNEQFIISFRDQSEPEVVLPAEAGYYHGQYTYNTPYSDGENYYMIANRILRSEGGPMQVVAQSADLDENYQEIGFRSDLLFYSVGDLFCLTTERNTRFYLNDSGVFKRLLEEGQVIGEHTVVSIISGYIQETGNNRSAYAVVRTNFSSGQEGTSSYFGVWRINLVSNITDPIFLKEIIEGEFDVKTAEVQNVEPDGSISLRATFNIGEFGSWRGLFSLKDNVITHVFTNNTYPDIGRSFEMEGREFLFAPSSGALNLYEVGSMGGFRTIMSTDSTIEGREILGMSYHGQVGNRFAITISSRLNSDSSTINEVYLISPDEDLSGLITDFSTKYYRWFIDFKGGPGNGWTWNETFGWFLPTFYTNLGYSTSFEWVYGVGDYRPDLWFYIFALDTWAFTSKELPNMIYRTDTNSWYWVSGSEMIAF